MSTSLQAYIVPTEGLNRESVRVAVVRKTNTAIIVRGRTKHYEFAWKFNKTDMLRTGEYKESFPRWKLILEQ